MSDSSKVLSRPCVKDLRSHLVCGICMGYFVDATTINECLHTFCRSCIVKYLDTSNYCPMCDVQIHKSKPLQNLRPDKMLQDLVYKVVPSFYSSEMHKRREFYSKSKEKGILTPEADNLMTPEMRGEPGDSQHYSPDESISLSLEYYIDNDEETDDENQEEDDDEPEEEESDAEQKPNPTRRYYKCPAAVCIRILKKLLRSKYGLPENEKVDIIYKKECLPEHFTLMDVGYIFSCKKKGLLKFYFRFYTRPQSANAVSTKSVKRTITDNVNGEVKRPRVNSDEAGSTQAGDSRKPERQISQPLATSTHSTSVPLEEPEKRPAKENSPAARLPSPKRVLDKPEEKSKRPNVLPADESVAPPAKKPKPAESPRLQKPAVVSPAPPTPSPPTPKATSEPPKPIQPGLKPPSQTSLLLKQQIAQQREQQKKMQIKQQQQQQLLKMQRQQMLNQKQAKVSLNKTQSEAKSMMAMKQMPQLQKVPQKQMMKNNARPVMPQPATASIGTQSLPIVTKTPESAPKQTMPTQKPTTPQMVKSTQVQAKPPPTSSVPTTVSVSTSTAISKPVSAASPSQTNPPPITTAEQRKLTSDMIEKNKMRPVVVIERHGNGRPKVKQVPSPLKLHQQMSREFNKIISAEQPSTPKQTTPATTLTVAPTDSATKLKIVKTPTTSPENKEEANKKPEQPKQASKSPQAEEETPKGKNHNEVGALDLSGKSSRKSDSPCSSVGSPSPPAPKVPSPVLPIEQRKSPPAPPKAAPPPPAPQKQPQPQQPKPQKPAVQKKDQNVMKIAQNCLNEKFAFFRQFPNPTPQAPSPPSTSDAAALSKITSFSYQSLMNEAFIRSKAQQQYKAFVQQHQQRGVRMQNAQKLNTYGPRPNKTPPQNNSVTIRIPTANKPESPVMTPNRMPPRIHDLFPNPQAKPGPNQAVRHIPNPSLLGRQNAMRMQQPMDPAAVRKDEITITPARSSPGSANPQVSSLRKIETLTQNLQRSICEGKMSPPGMGVVATEASQ
ncbi:polycomb group protein Psc-like [Neocloeon triangulifer]|uniref:polycomb group protein Psc-like n=1 Tax=Neocloeon triangulifer TaxID=2078957 RepID=UPI00286EBBFA|nr:polycomb group protein Psc-like [Neocloeon triangulifer]